MGFTRRNIILRRLIILTAVLVLFEGIGTARATQVGKSISFGIQSVRTNTIRPFEPVERDMLSIYDLVYESLVQIDENYMPQPYLAERWEESSGGKYWTFYLRRDVSFTDGTPLTAADVVASAQYILDKANDENITDHGFYSNLKYFVSGISAKDDYTVTVKTSRPYFGLLYAMTFPVVPAAYVGDDNPPGSGPYRIQEFHPGESMWIAVNDGWWKTRPQVQEINFLLHETARKVIESYEFGQVIAIFTRSIAGAQYKTGTSAVSMNYRTNQLECLLMNNSSYERTVNARKASRSVIDKSRLIATAYSGMARETDFPFFPGTWMYNSGYENTWKKDVEKAKQLLAEDGWEDTDENGILDKLGNKGKQVNLSLRLYYYEEPDNDVRAVAVNIISDSLAEIGIECRIDAMTLPNLEAKLKAGSYDLALVSYAMDVCPDPGFILMKGNTGNYFRYKSEKMDNLCKSLRTQVTQEGFRQKLMEIQALFYEDCPFLCLYWRTGTVVSRYMYTTNRDVREYQLLRGIQGFFTK